MKQSRAHRGQPPNELYGSSYKTAADMIGPIMKGVDVFGLTAGQFSFIDILVHVLQQIGPAHLVISTWTAAGASIRKAEHLAKRRDILSMRWIVDRSFQTRQPKLCQLLQDIWGADAVRTGRMHAKFMAAWNAEYHVVVRTSMNLNQNPRIEDFTITEDERLCNFVRGLVDNMFGSVTPEECFSNRSNELAHFELPETGSVKIEETPLCIPTSPLKC